MKLIFATQPWGVFQDQLVVELRLLGARTLEEANRVLAGFLPDYNRRFWVASREQAVWRKWPPARQLDRILCRASLTILYT